MHVAVATSLVVMIPTAMASAWKHYQQKNLHWATFSVLGVGIAVGSFVGVFLAGHSPRSQLETLFGIFELIIGLQLLRNVVNSTVDTGKPEVSRTWELFTVGSGIGSLSSMLGIGGGTMTVPYLNWRGFGIHRAIGTSAACGLIIAITGSAGFVFLNSSNEAALLFGYVYFPAAIPIGLASTLCAGWGAKLGKRFSTLVLRRIMGLVLLLVGFKLLF